MARNAALPASEMLLDALGEVVMLEQVGHLHVLVIDDIAFAHKRQRRLVVKVLALAPHLLMCFGEQRDRLAATDAPLLTTRDTPLGGFQRPFGRA
jgi:hypothetical protein